MKHDNKGFGVMTLLVIVAIVLVVGAYLYYQQPAPATPETGTTAPDQLNASVTIPAGTMMEDGTASTSAAR